VYAHPSPAAIGPVVVLSKQIPPLSKRIVLTLSHSVFTSDLSRTDILLWSMLAA
jgi:hypothetical protein